MRNWISRVVAYATYDWLITVIVVVGVLLVVGVAFGDGESGPVMITTLVIGLIMGFMVAARQRSIQNRPKTKRKRR